MLDEQIYIQPYPKCDPTRICLSLIPLSHWSRPTKLGEPGGNVDQASAKRDQVGVLWSEAGPSIKELHQRLQRFMTELLCQQLLILDSNLNRVDGLENGTAHVFCVDFLLVPLEWAPAVGLGCPWWTPVFSFSSQIFQQLFRAIQSKYWQFQRVQSFVI